MERLKISEIDLRRIIREELKRSGADKILAERGALRRAAGAAGKFMTAKDTDYGESLSPEDIEMAERVADAVRQAGGSTITGEHELTPEVMGLSRGEVVKYLQMYQNIPGHTGYRQ